MKNQNGYTEGPWKVKAGSDYTRIVRGDRWIAEMVEEENYSGDFIIPTVEEMQADARLIAAAPELLEALKNFCAAVREGEQPNLLYIIQALTPADAAISKAEGK